MMKFRDGFGKVAESYRRQELLEIEQEIAQFERLSMIAKVKN